MTTLHRFGSLALVLALGPSCAKDEIPPPDAPGPAALADDPAAAATPAESDSLVTTADEPTTPAPDDELALLVAWMSGSFSSAEQAARDPEFLDIRLFMTRIWQDRYDGAWLYVEQATATALERPYRQRVYHVTRGDDGRLRSDVFELPGDPLVYAGAWREPSRFAALEPSALKEREGCAIVLFRDGVDFSGATSGDDCPSSLRGAVYATSVVRISATGMNTWDRGFDANGAQVWGATKGPYEFLRIDG